MPSSRALDAISLVTNQFSDGKTFADGIYDLKCGIAVHCNLLAGSNAMGQQLLKHIAG